MTEASKTQDRAVGSTVTIRMIQMAEGDVVVDIHDEATGKTAVRKLSQQEAADLAAKIQEVLK